MVTLPRFVLAVVLTLATLAGLAPPALAGESAASSDAVMKELHASAADVPALGEVQRRPRGSKYQNIPHEIREQYRLLHIYLRRVARAARQQAQGGGGGGGGGGGDLVWHWAGVAQCESSGNWSINTGNGYYGGLQFSLPTWRAYGGQGMPNEQPASYQAMIADRVRTQSGLHHWPVCGRYYR